MKMGRELRRLSPGACAFPLGRTLLTSSESRSFLVRNPHLLQSAIEIITGKPDVNRGVGDGGGKQLVGEILGADVAPGQS